MSGKSRPKRIVAVDWDAHTLRVVHANVGKRGASIDRLLAGTIPSSVDPSNPKQMGIHLRRTLDHEGIATKHAVVDVPRDQAILKMLTLPIARAEELPGMVEIQIAKELPFPVKDAVIDFAVADTEKKETTGEVLVAAIRREVVEQYEATLEAAGLKLVRLGLRPYANKLAVCELLKHALPERVLFIDVRPTFMEIDVLREGSLVFSRSASVTIAPGDERPGILSIAGDSAAATEPVRAAWETEGEGGGGGESTVTSLVMEVTRSIEAYRAVDPGAKIDHVVLGGDVGIEESLAETLQRRLGTTVETYNPATSFGWEPDEGARAAAFAASLGLVIGFAAEDRLQFDFLHPKRTVSVGQERLRKAPMVAAVVALFVAAIPVALMGSTRDQRATLAKLEKSIEELEGKQADYKKFLDLVKTIDEFDAQQHVWVDVLRDIVSVLPSNEEMFVTEAEMTQKDGRVTIRTMTRERDIADRVVEKLSEFRRDGRELPRFKVTMGGQTEKPREIYRFSQELKIEILDDEPRGKGSLRGSSRSGD